MKTFLLITLLLSASLFAEHHKIQLLLTNPRSVSTAFEKCMMNRGDHKVFHEPWSRCYINHTTLPGVGREPPSEITEAQSYWEIKELVYRWANQKPVFIKDMIWSTGRDFFEDTDLLSDPNIELTILIREPSRCMESFFLKGMQPFPYEMCVGHIIRVFKYEYLLFLAERYKMLRHKWPTIIEAEELCSNPEETMRRYCQRSGIPFIADSLNWKTSKPEEWAPVMFWHEDASKSTGFYVPDRDHEQVRFSKICEQQRDPLEEIYQQQLPYYLKLKELAYAQRKEVQRGGQQ